MELLERIRRFPSDIQILLSSPTSVFVAVLLIFQLGFASCFSLVFPLLVRWYILPSSVAHEIPLNIGFHTCEQELHGVCSFPNAVTTYDAGSLFSPQVPYGISVRLRFADLERAPVGMFQNVVKITDAEGKSVATYAKTAYARNPSLFTKATWVMFFPLYFIGWFDDYQSLELLFTSNHIESDRLSTQLRLEIQNRFAEIEGASLLVHAQFGLIRHLLHRWPLLTSVFLIITCFSTCLALIFIYWGTHSCMYLTSNSTTDKSEETNSARHAKGRRLQDVASKSKPISGEKGPSIKKVPDEFVPENVEEIPECPVLDDIPGWDVIPDDLAKDVQLESSRTKLQSELFPSVRQRKASNS